MNRILYLFLFFAAFQLTSVASEEEFVPWQSVSITSPEIPVVGVIVVHASTQNDTYKKLEVTAFGRVHALTANDLKQLEGFPLSSLILTHEAGYVQLGGHTVYLTFRRTFYNKAKKLVQESVMISVPKNAALTVSERNTR